MTKIFVMTHTKFNVPTDPVYVPLQVGRAAGTDLGYLGDDTGDSISAKNCYYGELTGIYWLWKNYVHAVGIVETEPLEDNIGVCHYRRFFINTDKEMLKEADYDRILAEYDIITSKAMEAEGSYCEMYARAHNRADLEAEAEVIKELYPQDYPVFCRVMEGTKYYFGNLMVTSRKLFEEYCAWLFPIFSELEKRIDVDGYDEYHKRIYGFLSEQLLLVWITIRGLKVYECPVGVTGEKVETKQLKLAVGELLRQDRLQEALYMYNEVLKIRPDVSLGNSDLSGEIPIIGQILLIAGMEQKNGETGLLAYSRDLKELISHIRNIIRIIEKEDWSEDDIAYLKSTHVTETAVAALNIPEIKAGT